VINERSTFNFERPTFNIQRMHLLDVERSGLDVRRFADVSDPGSHIEPLNLLSERIEDENEDEVKS